MPNRKESPNGYGAVIVSAVEQARKTETKNFDLETIIGWIRDGKGRFATNVAKVRKAVGDGNKELASS
jgi:hypothetical protein